MKINITSPPLYVVDDESLLNCLSVYEVLTSDQCKKKRRAKRKLYLTSMKLKMEPTSDPFGSANSEIASNIIASYLKIATHSEV